MFKMEIRIDRKILEADGYDYEHTMNLLCENFKRAGFVEEVNEECHLIYRGTDSPKDFSYLILVAKRLTEQKWFKDCVKEWLLFSNDTIGSEDFVCVGDYIQSAKDVGIW